MGNNFNEDNAQFVGNFILQLLEMLIQHFNKNIKLPTIPFENINLDVFKSKGNLKIEDLDRRAKKESSVLDNFELNAEDLQDFDLLMRQNNLSYNYKEMEDSNKVKISYIKSDYQKILDIVKALQLKNSIVNEVSPSQFLEYLRLKEDNYVLFKGDSKENKITKEEIELLRLNKTDNDPKFTVLEVKDNYMIAVPEEDLERMKEKLARVRNMSRGENKDIVTNSMKNRIRTREFKEQLNDLKFEDDEKQRDLSNEFKNKVIIDASDPNKMIDMSQYDWQAIKDKEEFEKKNKELKTQFFKLTLPCVVTLKQYQELMTKPFDKQMEMLNEQMGYFMQDIKADTDVSKEEKTFSTETRECPLKRFDIKDFMKDLEKKEAKSRQSEKTQQKEKPKTRTRI